MTDAGGGPGDGAPGAADAGPGPDATVPTSCPPAADAGPGLDAGAALAATALYWTEDGVGGVWRAGVDGQGAKRVVSVSGQTNDLVLDPGAGRLYWLLWGDGTGNSKIQRALLDGTAIEDVVTGLDDNATDLALLPGASLYFSANGIHRASLDGSGLAQWLPYPRVYGIAVDAIGGFVYYNASRGESGQGLYRARLDGSCATEIIPGAHADGIAIDHVHGNLYYTAGALYRAKLDGSGVVSLGQAAFDVAVDPVAGQLYWSDYFGRRVMRGDLDGAGAIPVVDTVDPPIGVELGD